MSSNQLIELKDSKLIKDVEEDNEYIEMNNNTISQVISANEKIKQNLNYCIFKCEESFKVKI